MGLKDLNKNIEIKNEKNIKILILMIVINHLSLYLYDITDRLIHMWPWPYNFATAGMVIVTTLPILIVYFKFGLYKESVNFKNWKQYVIGIILAVPIWLLSLISYTDIFADFSDYARYDGDILWYFFYYFIFVALVEEFIYRVYMQGELTVLLGKAKWLAPLLASIVFGFAHIVQGSMEQVIFTFFMGLVLGYAKYFIKDCTFISVIIAHGLYDFWLAVSAFI
ncbi:MAG: CPBP family intramembrane metalloprotease [Lachnospiraceae bacterium]|nr:CPBP family intramembrane metalloprotease [Lachnospiraceae bacterium]